MNVAGKLFGSGLAKFPPVLKRVVLWMTAMMAVSLAFTMGMTHLLHPDRVMYGFAWIARGYQFCDFHFFQERSLHFRQPDYWNDFDYPFTYTAPDAVLLAMVFKLSHPLRMYLVWLPLEAAAWALWLARGLAARGLPPLRMAAFALVLLGTSWPAWYVVDVANLEGLVALVLALGVLATLRDWTWFGIPPGGTLIVLAGAMKVYPVVLLGLLLSKRRYKELAAALALLAVLMVGSLAIVGPTMREAQYHLTQGTIFLRENYIVMRGAVQLNFSHALFNPIKFGVLLIDRIVNHHGVPASGAHEQAILEVSLRIYLVATAILGVALYFGRLRRMPMLNQTLALTICGVVLTPFSSDYTLIQLFIPFGLLCLYTVDASLAANDGKLNMRGLETCFACFCFILAFETFFTWKYAFASSVRALALCVLLVTVLRFPYCWAPLDGAGPEAAQPGAGIAAAA